MIQSCGHITSDERPIGNIELKGTIKNSPQQQGNELLLER
jgi:hypothetical protein